MEKKTKEKQRKIRTYKATDDLYSKAKRKAKKENTFLATKIESLLYDYISR